MLQKEDVSMKKVMEELVRSHVATMVVAVMEDLV
jgi:hypothetical protein